MLENGTSILIIPILKYAVSIFDMIEKKKFLLGKKAISHIEVIISMMIFVIFVFFIIYYINPVRHQNINNVLSSILQDSIQKNTQVTLFETPLILSASISTCFGNVSNPYSSSNNISVFDANKKQVFFQLITDKLSINNGSGGIYYIYYSPNQQLINTDQPGMWSSSQCISIDSSFSSTRHLTPYSRSKLNDMQDKYYNDYNGLKTDIDFPLRDDFNVFVHYTGDNTYLINMTTKIPEKVEVFATEIPIQVMENSGEISSAVLNIQVW